MFYPFLFLFLAKVLVCSVTPLRNPTIVITTTIATSTATTITTGTITISTTTASPSPLPPPLSSVGQGH